MVLIFFVFIVGSICISQSFAEAVAQNFTELSEVSLIARYLGRNTRFLRMCTFLSSASSLSELIICSIRMYFLFGSRMRPLLNTFTTFVPECYAVFRRTLYQSRSDITVLFFS